MEIDKMPEWMMDYCASIGEESFTEYRNLATKYQSEISRYIERGLAEQTRNNLELKPIFKPKGWGKTIEESRSKDIDPRAKIYSINERYKKEALDIACKHGYERPNKGMFLFDDKFTTYQEQSKAFSKVLSKDDLNTGKSPEDAIAKYAHQQYFKKNPKAKERFEATKYDLRRLEYEEQHPDPFNHPYETSIDEKALKEKLISEKMEKFTSNFSTSLQLPNEVRGKDARDKDMDER